MLETLEKQIAAAKGKILILATEVSTTVLEDSMSSKSQADIELVDNFSDTRKLPNNEYSLVICFGCDNAETHQLYTLANRYKLKGIPVVFGNPQRGLILHPPTWKDVDLHMTGMFYLANLYIRSIGTKGSYAEFGVFDGRSMTLAYHALKSSVNKFIGFDSFEGIVGSISDETGPFPEGSYFANIETFWHNMHVAGVDVNRVNAVKGAFQETLVTSTNINDSELITIAHIDSDIYEAAYLALNYLKPRMVPGALILFDEYHVFGADPNRGERRAVREWLNENQDVSLELYRNYTAFGTAFIYRTK